MSTDTTTEARADGAAEESSTGTDAIIGKVIDGCRVQRKLGQGGMGVVYLAVHETLKQEFVLKILNPALTGSEDTIERFFREAQACAQLNHPGIVAIQNVGQDGDYFFIRMEYVEGVTLEDLVKEKGQLDWRQATQLMLETVDALSHAHQKGMIHRDIKPENIMFTSANQVKVMDFGLAKHVHSSAKVSVTGQIVGTPFFMSPEQAGGKPTDARSDIYSVGVTLYYLMTGVKPFNGKNLQEIFLKHFFYAPESPKIYNESLPDSLCEVVKRCLKKKKKERYQSAKALAHDLQQVLSRPDAPLAEEGEGGGGAAPPPPDAGFEEGDQTMVSSPANRTVKVDPEGDATVRVASEGDDATVQVHGGGGGVTFGTASQVFNAGDDPDATLEIDEEPAHAGLDLPTALIDAAKGGGAAAPAAPAKPELTEEERARRKKKLIIAAVVLAVPLLLVGLLNLLARMDHDALARRYEALRANPTTTADELEALVVDVDGFIAKHVLAPTYVANAEQLKVSLQQRIAEVRRKEEQEAERQRDAARRAEREQQHRDALTKYKAEADAKLAELADLRLRAEAEMKRPGGSSGPLWEGYLEQAGKLHARLTKILADTEYDFSELAGRLEQVRFPAIVNSFPPGASIHVAGQSKAAGTTPGVVFLPPNQPVVLEVKRRGFVTAQETFTATAEALLYPDFTLVREEIEAKPPALGTVRVPLGPTPEDEPITPVPGRAVEVVRSRDGLAYFIDHAGLLRAFELRRGKPLWMCPEGPSCREGPSHPHQVGLYGDPTPALYVVDGKVVLASSLLGNVTAHDALTGRVIWSCELGSPVTTRPYHKSVFKLIAVGTSSGEVAFLGEQAGQVEWRFPTENAVVSTPFFWGDRFCIVGSTDNRVYSLDWRDRKPVDRLDLGDDVVIGPIPVGRNLLLGTRSGRLHLVAVDGEGMLERVRELGEPSGEPITGIAVEGRAVYYTTGSELRALDEEGKSLWEGGAFKAASNLTAPTLPPGGGAIFVGGANGLLYAIDRESGEAAWSHPFGGKPINVPPVVLDGRLYVFVGGRIHVLHAD